LGTIPLRFHKQVDVFTGLVHGTRSALIFGVSAAFFTGLIGVILGAISAWAGGWLNSLIMRITDAVLALPVIVGVVVLQQVLLMLTTAQTYGLYYGLGEEITPVGFSGFIVWLIRTLDPVLLAVILFSWMPYARITNTVVFQVKGSGYIQAAKALGGSSAHTIFRHIIPNSITPAVVLFARDIGGFVLLQATFTFIGLGGESEWGATLAYARDWIIGPGGDLLSRWWVFIPATLTLVLFGIGWNLLGDGLNDWLNPRLRREIQM
jgi:peptide/nickel transport system permease protein